MKFTGLVKFTERLCIDCKYSKEVNLELVCLHPEVAAARDRVYGRPETPRPCSHERCPTLSPEKSFTSFPCGTTGELFESKEPEETP